MTETRENASAGKIQRRTFLKAAAGFPLIAPASALGLGGRLGPNSRIALGCIGMGAMGMANMRGFLGFSDVRVVAVCDVDRPRREQAQQEVNAADGSQDCRAYNDFRELLALRGLDAVSLALPDHWHAIPAIWAARAGLDIYSETPLAHSISEGRAMVKAVERCGAVWQSGSWQRSKEHFRRACELVRNGVLGAVSEVEVGLPPGRACAPQPAMPAPEGFDYDFWLGPAPEAPYTEKRCHWNFRWIYDYAGGQMADWASHHCDIVNWAMDTEETGPEMVEGTGAFPEDGLWDTALSFKIVCRYGAGKSKVSPRGFSMVLSSDLPLGVRFRGEHGSLYVNRGNILEASPESLLATPLDENAERLYESENHAANFIECVRTRRQTAAPVRAAHSAAAVAHLGNISMRLGRPLHWDPAREQFTRDAAADKLLFRPPRAPWRL